MEVLILIIIALILYCIVQSYEWEPEPIRAKPPFYETCRQYKKAFDDKLDKVVEYTFVDSETKTMYVYAVDKSKCIYLLFIKNEGCREVQIPFHEVKECRICQGKISDDSLFRAMIGQQTMGTTGAIVGFRTGRKTIDDFAIKIIRDNATQPCTQIVLIDKKTSLDSELYEKASAFATNVRASVQSIVTYISTKEETPF